MFLILTKIKSFYLSSPTEKSDNNYSKLTTFHKFSLLQKTLCFMIGAFLNIIYKYELKIINVTF